MPIRVVATGIWERSANSRRSPEASAEMMPPPALGVLLGMILPARVMSALNVALYGMFLACVIPPSRKNRIVAGVVVISMAASWAFTKLPVVKEISSGFQIIILTIAVASAAAVLFPVREDSEGENTAGEEDEYHDA